MIVDARGLRADVECDVAVVGAGPAGITLALELERHGISTVVLESGGREVDPATSHLLAGESTGYPYHRLDVARARAFAGTTRRWPANLGFRARPLDAIDFEPREGVTDAGWPFTRHDLWPHYERAMDVAGIVAPEDHIGAWSGDELPPGLEGTPQLRTIKYQWARADAFTRHWYALLAARHVRLVLHATVTRIATEGRPDAVSGLRVATPAGSTFHVRAQRYVIALGGIENARMLLVSTDSRHPRGLGNEHDQVGRYFMEHPIWDAAVIRPRDPSWSTRAGAHSAHDGGVLVDRWLTVDDTVMRAEGLLGCAFRLVPEPAVRLSSGAFAARELFWRRLRTPGMAPETRAHLGALVRSPGDLARNAAWRARGRPMGPQWVKVETQAEQAPNPESRVTLGSRADAFGVPVARLHWDIAPADLASMRRSVAILGEAVRAAGIGEFVSMVDPARPHSTPWGGNHQMGTTRMHADPARGVVDTRSRVHSVENLYVAGSSVFPTGGASTPTLTLVALAVRLADDLAASLRAPVDGQPAVVVNAPG